MKKTREEHNKNYLEIVNYLKKVYPEYEVGFEGVSITPWGGVEISLKLIGESHK